ncbi:TPA: helix-turn-helix transcriptional regulator [Bacillus luti]|nr:helix-turn-helix transcriptional regulator [Bacillus luti]
MKEFSETLKKLRKSRDLTQQQLGDEINASRGQIKNYENGFEPDLVTLDRIASFFNVTVDVLLNRNIKEDDSQLENAFIKLQHIYITLTPQQKENFCKKVTSFAEFLDADKEIL